MTGWQARGCAIGLDTTRCGRPIVGAFAITVASDAWQLDDQRPGVLLLCQHHFAALNAPLPEDPCSPPISSAAPSPPPP